MEKVTPDVSHERLSCKTFPHLLIKMINKSRWKILGLLAVFLLMVWYTISREESFDFHFQDEKMTCPFKEVEKKAAQLIPNYTREPPLFLHLKDYFWVKTPSLYELPYGTKGTDCTLKSYVTRHSSNCFMGSPLLTPARFVCYSQVTAIRLDLFCIEKEGWKWRKKKIVTDPCTPEQLDTRTFFLLNAITLLNK
uniref:Uncharacterized protein n=1 Tax=Micrurus paraensis TaxID=1970185 RepID=A0A2D4L4U6_9SAUR